MTRVLVPAGALGLGWDDGALAAGLAAGPDIIAIDGGSTDSGPSYLGRGVSKYSRARIKADWGQLVRARDRLGVPLVVGTAGTCGTGTAVDWLADITREVLAEAGIGARIARLYCDRDPAAIAQNWQGITPLAGAPEVAASDAASCTNIVALAGVEQVQAALATGADIVIAGRTTDTAVLAALPIARGADVGAAWHGAKVAECGALCTTHPWSGAILMDVDDTGFTITPCLAEARATPQSVAAHMLYENADPVHLHEPGGYLDVSDARYTAMDAARVRVEGARWVPQPYTVKLEGARAVGYGATALALVRDAAVLDALDLWCDTLLAEARRRLDGLDAQLSLMRIGRDATLGPGEPEQGMPVEVGVMLKVLAPTQATAMEAAQIVNPLLLHHSAGDGPMPTFAFPFSPPEMATGSSSSSSCITSCRWTIPWTGSDWRWRMPRLIDLALVRSKNAGPFWLTIDLFCEDFAVVSAIPTARFADRLGVDAQSVKRFDLPDLAVVKLSMPRPVVQGAFADRDMHGAGWGAALAGMAV